MGSLEGQMTVTKLGELGALLEDWAEACARGGNSSLNAQETAVGPTSAWPVRSCCTSTLNIGTATGNRVTARSKAAGSDFVYSPTAGGRAADSDSWELGNIFGRKRMNDCPYDNQHRKFREDLKRLYDRWVRTGVCMATIRMCSEEPADACGGPIGDRHAIAKRHLQLIAEGSNREIRANKEIGSFEKWSEQHDALQRLSISKFSTGKWSCQRHDERFKGIDDEPIDLSEPENLFKAVYRVVVRQNHLSAARWSAHWEATRTRDGWEGFKETAFCEPIAEERAIEAEKKWECEAHALMWKMRDLERRLAKGEWKSLDYQVLLLQSKPVVAGWGCLIERAADPSNYFEMGYKIVIPEQVGHAIITACEREPILPGVKSIHSHMPTDASPDTPYQADEYLKPRISNGIWELNEIGIRESLYQSWSDAEKDRVQAWMKKRGLLTPRPPGNLPAFF